MEARDGQRPPDDRSPLAPTVLKGDMRGPVDADDAPAELAVVLVGGGG